MQNHANITIRIPYHHTHNLADRQDKKYTSQPTKRGGIMLKRLHKAESKQKKTNRIWRGKKHLAMHANPLSARMHNPILEEQWQRWWKSLRHRFANRLTRHWPVNFSRHGFCWIRNNPLGDCRCIMITEILHLGSQLGFTVYHWPRSFLNYTHKYPKPNCIRFVFY